MRYSLLFFHTGCGYARRCKYNKKHFKNVGPIRHCEPFYIAIHQVSLLSHAPAHRCPRQRRRQQRQRQRVTKGTAMAPQNGLCEWQRIRCESDARRRTATQHTASGVNEPLTCVTMQERLISCLVTEHVEH